VTHQTIAYAATGMIAAATLVAIIIAGILLAHRTVPRVLAIADGLLCVVAVGLHFAAQYDENIGAGFAIAIPFLVMGAVAGVVLAWRRVSGERPKTSLTVAHAASLLIGLFLVIEGVLHVWPRGVPGT
jgi:hypothetical protein